MAAMASSSQDSLDVVVIGGGPAGVIAALRAARLGARTALITSAGLGGMAAADGPVPVRTLAHAARLIREARQLPRYGITAGEPALDYPRLVDRVGEVTAEVRAHSALGQELQQSGVAIHEHAGAARFIDPHLIESGHAPRLAPEKFIICTGGRPRRLDLPGFDLTCTHSDAWGFSSAPPSMLVIGAGATGVQVASIFNAFGSQVTLFEAAPRILMSEDHDVAAAVSAALQASGIRVLRAGRDHRAFRVLPRRRPADLHQNRHSGPHRGDGGGGRGRMGRQHRRTRPRRSRGGDRPARLRTGRLPASHHRATHLRRRRYHRAPDGRPRGRPRGYLAATNAVLGSTSALPADVSPIGSFTDPEYASVGVTEATARSSHDVTVATERFDVPAPTDH